jgi:hypothetical protein
MLRCEVMILPVSSTMQMLVSLSKMVHAALLMLEAVATDLVSPSA